MKPTWQERFDKEWNDTFAGDFNGWESIKAFISKELTLAKEEERKEVENLIMKLMWTDDGQVAHYDKENAQAFYNHNKTLEDVLDFIRNKE